MAATYTIIKRRRRRSKSSSLSKTSTNSDEEDDHCQPGYGLKTSLSSEAAPLTHERACLDTLAGEGGGQRISLLHSGSSCSILGTHTPGSSEGLHLMEVHYNPRSSTQTSLAASFLEEANRSADVKWKSNPSITGKYQSQIAVTIVIYIISDVRQKTNH